jgi:hypothetical protein
MLCSNARPALRQRVLDPRVVIISGYALLRVR